MRQPRAKRAVFPFFERRSADVAKSEKQFQIHGGPLKLDCECIEIYENHENPLETMTIHGKTH